MYYLCISQSKIASAEQRSGSFIFYKLESIPFLGYVCVVCIYFFICCLVLFYLFLHSERARAILLPLSRNLDVGDYLLLLLPSRGPRRQCSSLAKRPFRRPPPPGVVPVMHMTITYVTSFSRLESWRLPHSNRNGCFPMYVVVHISVRTYHAYGSAGCVFHVIRLLN